MIYFDKVCHHRFWEDCMAVSNDIIINQMTLRELLEENLKDSITQDVIEVPYLGRSGHSLGLHNWQRLAPCRNPFTRETIDNLSSYIRKDEHITAILCIMSLPINDNQLWRAISSYVEKKQYEITVLENKALRGNPHVMFRSIQECLLKRLSLYPEKKMRDPSSSQIYSVSLFNKEKFRSYQRKLTKEINSIWPFPNKQLKRKKHQVLELIDILAEAGVPYSVLIPKIREHFPQVVARGELSSRMHDLFNDLESINTLDVVVGPGQF